MGKSRLYWAHCLEGHDTFERGVDLRFDLQSALIYLGELGQTLDVLREAEKLAEALRDQRRLAKVWAHMTHCFWWMGDADRAVEYGQRARAVATALGDTTLEILVNIRLGQAFFTSGEFRRAIGVLDRDTAALEGEVRPHCHLGLGRLYRRTGDQANGGEHLAAATTLYGEMDMRFWLVQAQAEMRALA